MSSIKLFTFLTAATLVSICCGDAICVDQTEDYQSDNFIQRFPPIPCSQGSSFKCVAKQSRLRQIQYQLFSALNFSLQYPPGFVSSRSSLEGVDSNAVQRNYAAGESRKLIYANTAGPLHRRQQPDRFIFSLASLRPPYEITNATLFVHVQTPAQNSLSNQQIINDRVDFQMYLYANETDIAAEPLFNKTYKIGTDSQKWISMDLTQLAQHWAKHQLKNYGFYIKAKFADGEELINRTQDGSNHTNTHIFLDVVYRFEGNPMARYFWSNTNDDRTTCQEETSEDGKCCRYPLIVDFEALGLDFIIAPKRYNAYYCAGECHRRKRKRIATTISNSISTSSTAHCCSPKKYQDMKIIYISNKGSLEERIILKAIVNQCGCS